MSKLKDQFKKDFEKSFEIKDEPKVLQTIQNDSNLTSKPTKRFHFKPLIITSAAVVSFAAILFAFIIPFTSNIIGANYQSGNAAMESDVPGSKADDSASAPAVNGGDSVPQEGDTKSGEEQSMDPEYSSNESRCFIIAQYDTTKYQITDDLNRFTDFKKGFYFGEKNKENSFTVIVTSLDNSEFSVGININNTSITYSDAKLGEDGQYKFEEKLVFGGNVTIKVGATRKDVTFEEQ